MQVFRTTLALLLVPALSGADLTNTAQVSYRDAAGGVYTATSNTVTVTLTVGIQPPPPSTGLPTISLSSLPHVIPVNGTIQADVQNASVIHWTMTRQTAASSQMIAAALDLASVGGTSNVSTPSPMLSLTPLSLVPGNYTLQVTAENNAGVLSAPVQADVTLVAADLNAIKVYPNPWREDRHSGVQVTFDQLTDNVRIKVFNVSGQLVKDLGNAVSSAKWDLTNDSGNRVGSGLYLYLITNSAGQHVRGKLAVVH